MRVTAYQGPETGSRDVASYVLESGGARFVVSAPVHAGTALGEHIARHGDGVVDIALRVPDAQRAYELAVARGAHGLAEPEIHEDDTGQGRRSPRSRRSGRPGTRSWNAPPTAGFTFRATSRRCRW